MGPFELIDYVGIDTFKLICDGFVQKGIMPPVKIIDQMVAKGFYGKKNGKGFYTYNKKASNYVIL
jgi:3-hydroxyacyl-CoA dehydrogenase